MKQDAKRPVRRRGSFAVLIALVAALTVVVSGSGASGDPSPPPGYLPAGSLVIEDGVITQLDESGGVVATQALDRGCNSSQGNTLLSIAATEGEAASTVAYIDNGLAVKGAGDGNGRRSACAYVEGEEAISLTLNISDLVMIGALFDMELKQGSQPDANLSLDGAPLENDPGDILMDISGCGSDSCPDSEDNAVFEIELSPTAAFDEITMFEADGGNKGFAIEDGGDSDALIPASTIYLAQQFPYSGNVSCTVDDDNPSVPNTFVFPTPEDNLDISGTRLANLDDPGDENCDPKDWFGDAQRTAQGALIDYILTDITQVSQYLYEVEVGDLSASTAPVIEVDYGGTEGAVELDLCAEDGLSPVTAGSDIVGFARAGSTVVDSSQISDLDQSSVAGLQYSCLSSLTLVSGDADLMDLSAGIWNVGDVRYFFR